MSDRPPVPEQLRRSVLVEAHHRCAICREPSFDIAHIEPWSKVREHRFENLIALCPNCHRRHERKEIDNQSLRMYKANLSVIYLRYSDYERRILEFFAQNPDATTVDLAGGEVHLLYLVRDGLLRDLGPTGSGITTDQKLIGTDENLWLGPRHYEISDAGRDFVNRWLGGEDLSQSE